ncbi:MAG: FKBP-type peptidyl-prolyl cis-trans isomerase [archaeon]|nr:FKBP-type peptidyl-prolyl cis-trans isomerase [archaeon]
METVNKKDFVELKFTGFTNGNIFDSNVEEDLKKIDPKGKPRPLIICAGEGMVVAGLDNALEGKEIGKQYEVSIPAKEGFGERRRDLVKTIPLKIFTEQKINPYAGMVLAMDNSLAKVITVSGARVMTDFNNPLAGKDLVYKFTITRKLTDDREKATALFSFVFRFVPEFEIKEDKIIISGPKPLEYYVNAFKDKFRDLLGKELGFVLKEEKKEGKEVNAKENKPSEESQE